MIRTPVLFLVLLPATVLAQSSVDELRSASDKAQVVHESDQPVHVVPLGGDSVYDLASVEEIPHYPGGEQAMYDYLKKNVKYPAEAMEAGIQGKVYVEFVVAKEGSIGSVRSLRAPDSALSKEAVRVVQAMPKWTPGMQLGKPVNVKFILPINFRLDDDPPPAKKK